MEAQTQTPDYRAENEETKWKGPCSSLWRGHILFPWLCARNGRNGIFKHIAYTKCKHVWQTQIP